VTRRREKSEHKRIQTDLIRTVTSRKRNDRSMEPLMKVTFMERLGFKNKKKEDKLMAEAVEIMEALVEDI